MADTAETPSLLKRVAELTILLAFYLYFAGWSYASELFTGLGLSLNAIETPVYFFIVYAYRVFFQSVLGVVVLLLVAGGWYLLAILNVSRARELLLIGILAIVPFPAVHWLAGEAATKTASEIRSGHATTVTFTVRPEGRQNYSPDFVKFVEGTTFYLVTQTDEVYYVVFQGPPEPGTRELPRALGFDMLAADFIARKKLLNTKEAS